MPNLQREAAYALGATRWEVLKIAVLSYARRGLFGAAILGLGRALGETMAVTMVIGNRPQISASLFAPGYTLASVIANGEIDGKPLGHLEAMSYYIIAATAGHDTTSSTTAGAMWALAENPGQFGKV